MGKGGMGSGWVKPIFSSRAKIDTVTAYLVIYDWCSLGRIDVTKNNKRTKGEGVVLIVRLWPQ